MAQSGVDPVNAWQRAAENEFVDRVAAIKKGCPKSAFLGLAEEGHIQGIPSGSYTTSKRNKRYALELFRLLKGDHGLVDDRRTLWVRACGPEHKAHNGQMDVVIALWSEGLLH
nr:hypothetical protein [Kushneria sinocarnis]